MAYLIGIDVGTGSVRAGVFDTEGHRLAHATETIMLWQPQPGYAEQSSEQIWNAVIKTVREAVTAAEIDPQEICGLGFDATCSLVVLDADFRPVSVNPEGATEQNVIVWMDHRAGEEADFINQAGDFPVYQYVGGKVSLEMQTPKLLWLKRHRPESWRQAGHFFDLPDFLTFRATGSLSRSLCSTTCKWTYLPRPPEGYSPGWQADFFRAIDLGELADEGFRRIGTEVLPMGEPVGEGLTARAAHELGLPEGTPVGVSIIDAHAGGIGMLGIPTATGEAVDWDRRLALIGGTSSCHMAVSAQERPISGVWGPYYSSMVPGLWLNEGGQSATGSLIDHIIFQHGATAQAEDLTQEAGLSIYQFLNQRLVALAGDRPMAELTESLHVCPYFHGNRSPRADAKLMGMVSGLRLSATVDDLALLYLATVQAIAYGTRHIIEVMNAKGYQIDHLFCCGGGTKNPIFLQQHADITGCRLILPEEPESVLLGSAMLGAVASRAYNTLAEAMQAMSRVGGSIEQDEKLRPYHERKYRVFHQLYEDQMRYSTLMQD